LPRPSTLREHDATFDLTFLHLSDDDRLEVFSSAKDSMRISVLEDEALQDDLKLFHTGRQAFLAKGRKLYKFKLQP